MGLFDEAKKEEPKTKGKKILQKEVVLLKEKDHNGIGAKAKRLMELREETKALEAELAMTQDDVNTVARGEYIRLYKSKGENPKMFVIQCENGIKFNVTPADAYASVSAEKYEEISKKFGKGIVTKETIYSFNNKVLKDNMDAVSEAIMGSKKISDEDKKNLLIANDKFAIAKGTINNLMKAKKPEDLFEAIKPTVQVKF